MSTWKIQFSEEHSVGDVGELKRTLDWDYLDLD